MKLRAGLLIAVTTAALGLGFSACGGSDDSGGSPSDAGSDTKVIECVVPSDCDDGSPCTLDDCVDNACEHEVAPDGDAVDQTEGDCKKVTCKAGAPTFEVDNGDVPVDDEPCTLDVCTAGVPSNTPVLDGTKCEVGSGNGQCKAGVCWVLCTTSNQHIQCDDLNDCTEDACLPCDKPECEGKGLCSHQGLSGIPTPGAPQSTGDCKERRCVEGKDEEVDDNFDAPDDGNECTVDLCKAGEPGHLPQSVGTACGGGSYKCDGNGECVQCTSVADCDDYTPGDCTEVACTEGYCELSPLPAGTVCGANGEQCGPSGSCCESCASLGNACGTISNGCGETLNCGSCPSGQICYSDQCCTPKQCTAGACGSQSDGCGSTINCPSCPSGQVCYSQTCCTPKTCGAGSCGTTSDGCGGTITCGSCAPGDSCSSGTCGCFNGSKGTAETDVDCGGVCAAKCAQGLKCLAGSDCTTGYCVDGVCCNSACSGTCQACTAALTGQTTGTCASVTDGTDPGSECPTEAASTCGTTGVCQGGACAYHASSTQCGAASCSGSVQTAASYCSGSGTCVAGSQTSCPAPYVCGPSTTCQSCSDGAKNGNEWGVDCGAAGCPGCPNGTACTSSTQCASGQCIDGYCCNTSCGSLCMACNVSGNHGTCSPVPFGQDPLSECAGQKTCNGSGGCT